MVTFLEIFSVIDQYQNIKTNLCSHWWFWTELILKHKTKEKSSDKLTTDYKRQKIQFHRKQVCKGKIVLECKSISVSCHSQPTSTIKLPLDHRKGKSDNKINCPKETSHFKWYLLRSKFLFFAISFHVNIYRAPIQIIFPAQFWVAGTVKTNIAALTGKMKQQKDTVFKPSVTFCFVLLQGFSLLIISKQQGWE